MEKTLKISSIRENIHQAETFCREFLIDLNIDEDRINTSLIIITELVNNAIIHGNQADPQKFVRINMKYNEKSRILHFTITDEGPGFDDENLSDPTNKENLLKSSGRGIYIVKHYAKTFTHYVKNNKHVTEVSLDLS